MSRNSIQPASPADAVRAAALIATGSPSHSLGSPSHSLAGNTATPPSAAVSATRNVAKRIGVRVSPKAQKTDTQSRDCVVGSSPTLLPIKMYQTNRESLPPKRPVWNRDEPHAGAPR